MRLVALLLPIALQAANVTGTEFTVVGVGHCSIGGKEYQFGSCRDDAAIATPEGCQAICESLLYCIGFAFTATGAVKCKSYCVQPAGDEWATVGGGNVPGTCADWYTGLWSQINGEECGTVGGGAPEGSLIDGVIEVASNPPTCYKRATPRPSAAPTKSPSEGPSVPPTKPPSKSPSAAPSVVAQTKSPSTVPSFGTEPPLHTPPSTSGTTGTGTTTGISGSFTKPPYVKSSSPSASEGTATVAPAPAAPPSQPWVVPTVVLVGVGAAGAGAAAAAAGKCGGCVAPPPGGGSRRRRKHPSNVFPKTSSEELIAKVGSEGDSEESKAGGAEPSDTDVALFRMRKICVGGVANVEQVRVKVTDNAGDLVIICMPDKHLTHEEQRLVKERVLAELGPSMPQLATQLELKHLSPAELKMKVHNPYPDPDHERLAAAVRSACLTAVVDSRDPGVVSTDPSVVSMSITGDCHYFRFRRGVRLSPHQRYVLISKYREKIRGTARGRKAGGQKVNVNLMDDVFYDETGGGGGYEEHIPVPPSPPHCSFDAGTSPYHTLQAVTVAEVGTDSLGTAALGASVGLAATGAWLPRSPPGPGPGHQPSSAPVPGSAYRAQTAPVRTSPHAHTHGRSLSPRGTPGQPVSHPTAQPPVNSIPPEAAESIGYTTLAQ